MEEAFVHFSHVSMEFRDRIVEQSDLNMETGEMKTSDAVLNTPYARAKRFTLNKFIQDIEASIDEDFRNTYEILQTLIAAHNSYFKDKNEVSYEIDKDKLHKVGLKID